MNNNQNHSDDEIEMIHENERLLKDLSKDEVITMFDGFQVPPGYWNEAIVFPLVLDETLRQHDAFFTNTVIRESTIVNADLGLFTTDVIPMGFQFPYSGVLKLMYENHKSDEDVFYGTMKHRSVETMFQPFLHFGITMFVVGSYNSASTYMNDLDYFLKEPPTKTMNNCVIVGSPHGDVESMTVTQFKQWLKNIPVRVETSVEVPADTELVTSYLYRCAVFEIDDEASSDNDRASDSDWEP